MELFYAHKIADGRAFLDSEESAHLVKVLRHKAGDSISVIDGSGALMSCVLEEVSPREAVARIDSVSEGWGAHPYHLQMAVCPTKNIDRYEWFVEKAVELGVDEIVPVVCDHSERRVVRTDRLGRIAISAAKQSLKAAVPVIPDVVPLKDFLASCTCGLRLIAYCAEDVKERVSIAEVLHRASASGLNPARISILIGLEGDFSPEEVRAALDAGFMPVHLGPSRLRTETAALTAVEAVYLSRACGGPAYDSSNLQHLNH